MNREQITSTVQSDPITTDRIWDPLRPNLLPTGKSGQNEVKAFNCSHVAETNHIRTRAKSGAHIDSGYAAASLLGYTTTGFAFNDLPSRKGPRPVTLRGPLHIQCNGYGNPQHLDELTAAVLSWPYVESNLPNNSDSDTIPLRLEEAAAGYNFAAFISPREFGRVLTGAPTIYLALPLVCAHWAIVRGWAEPHYLCSYGLMPPGALVVYTPRDQHEASICYSLFLAAYTAAPKLTNSSGEPKPAPVN
jgi:hypothetical protein